MLLFFFKKIFHFQLGVRSSNLHYIYNQYINRHDLNGNEDLNNSN